MNEQPVIITSANIEYTSLFVLNCGVSLFDADITVDQLKHKRKLLNQHYRHYAKLLLSSDGIEHNEKINQLQNAMESMVSPANELVVCLTEQGLQQLRFSLRKEEIKR